MCKILCCISASAASFFFLFFQIKLNLRHLQTPDTKLNLQSSLSMDWSSQHHVYLWYSIVLERQGGYSTRAFFSYTGEGQWSYHLPQTGNCLEKSKRSTKRTRVVILGKITPENMFKLTVVLLCHQQHQSLLSCTITLSFKYKTNPNAAVWLLIHIKSSKPSERPQMEMFLYVILLFIFQDVFKYIQNFYHFLFSFNYNMVQQVFGKSSWLKFLKKVF